MEKRIYVETTVVSYLTAKPSRDIMIASHQEATRELWPNHLTKYDAYISALVFVVLCNTSKYMVKHRQSFPGTGAGEENAAAGLKVAESVERIAADLPC